MASYSARLTCINHLYYGSSHSLVSFRECYLLYEATKHSRRCATDEQQIIICVDYTYCGAVFTSCSKSALNQWITKLLRIVINMSDPNKGIKNTGSCPQFSGKMKPWADGRPKYVRNLHFSDGCIFQVFLVHKIMHMLKELCIPVRNWEVDTILMWS